MSTFSVRIKRVREPVLDHPNADRLSIIRIDGYECISAKLEDGSHRYRQGDYVVYVPEATIVPEWALRRYDFWSEEKARGILAGSNGDRVKSIKLRGTFSQGLLFPVLADPSGGHWLEFEGGAHVILPDGDPEGLDVAAYLGLTKWEPPIPVSMAGELCSAAEVPLKYDFEDLKSLPGLFREGEEVVATEKLHGSMWCASIHVGLTHPDFFGQGRNIGVNSKGLGSKGLLFKDVEENASNLYVNALSRLLKNGFEEALLKLAAKHDATSIHVFGEVFGKGVQDLAYDTSTPQFRAFEIAIDRQFLAYNAYTEAAEILDLPVVPLLYRGPFERVVLEGHRDGKTLLGGKHMREGIVVRAADGSSGNFGRKIAKMISPDYLLRKNPDATEFN